MKTRFKAVAARVDSGGVIAGDFRLNKARLSLKVVTVLVIVTNVD